jgi:hypothetical protein
LIDEETAADGFVSGALPLEHPDANTPATTIRPAATIARSFDTFSQLPM